MNFFGHLNRLEIELGSLSASIATPQKNGSENRQIALTLDNYMGHGIQYQPKRITLIYFEPDLTSCIQSMLGSSAASKPIIDASFASAPLNKTMP